MAKEYFHIEQYAVIGDGETAALIAPDGAIDWLCLPHFDSPAIFCRILDAERGGYFALAPVEPGQANRGYLAETNVFRTVYRTDRGQIAITDAMTCETDAPSWSLDSRDPAEHFNYPHRSLGHREVIRRIEGLEGTVRLRLSFKPTFDYARAQTNFELVSGGILAWADEHFLSLSCPTEIKLTDSVATAEITVRAGDEVDIVLLHANSREKALRNFNGIDFPLEHTIAFWRGWSARCTYEGRYRDLVRRSALALKLLHYAPTGAFVAAPTSSLPEGLGGARNWDYRYTWLRDASLTLHALFSLGYTAEGDSFFHFVEQACRSQRIQIMYGINGETDLPEEILPHLSGYENSQPVRIGNGAAHQKQLDVFGPVLDAAQVYVSQGGHLNGHLRDLWCSLVDYVCEHWREPDRGIWEVRSPDQHFVHSKLMAWVAVNRALQLDLECALEADRPRWQQTEREIRAEILEHGYNRDHQAFTQSYGSPNLDASVLLIPMVGFLPATDPRVQSTTQRIMTDLTEHGLVYRYRDTDDGLPGGEATFTICSFWLVENLAMQGRLVEAEELFNRVIDYAGPFGLLAEEIDPVANRQLGNYPQGFSHIGLINAALCLERAREQGPEHEKKTAADRTTENIEE